MNEVTSYIPANILSGLWVSSLFLFLGMFLNRPLEENVELLRQISEEQRRREEENRIIREFESFFSEESYREAIFPDLKFDGDPMGLMFIIEPFRKDGKPIIRQTEMAKYYLVKVQGPAYEGVLDKNQMLRFENSPIRTNEIYYCRFFSGSWNMCLADFGPSWHRFRLGGKLGPTEHVVSANRFAGVDILPDGFAEIEKFKVSPSSGEAPEKGESFNFWSLVKNQSGQLFIKPEDGPPKKMYFRNTQENPNEWLLVIEDMWGYMNVDARERFKTRLKDMALETSTEIPEIDWFRLDNQIQ